MEDVDQEEAGHFSLGPAEPTVFRLTSRRTWVILGYAASVLVTWLSLGCYMLWTELSPLLALWTARTSGGALAFLVLNFSGPGVFAAFPMLLAPLLVLSGALAFVSTHAWYGVNVVGLGELLLYEDRLVRQFPWWSQCVHFSGSERAERRRGSLALHHDGQRIIIPHGWYEREGFETMHALLAQRCVPYRECLTVRLPFEVRLLRPPYAVMLILMSTTIAVVCLVASWPPGTGFVVFCAVWLAVVVLSAWPVTVVFDASEICVHRLWWKRRHDARSLRKFMSQWGRLYLIFEHGVELGILQGAYPLPLLEKQVRDLYSGVLETSRPVREAPAPLPSAAEDEG